MVLMVLKEVKVLFKWWPPWQVGIQAAIAILGDRIECLGSLLALGNLPVMEPNTARQPFQTPPKLVEHDLCYGMSRFSNLFLDKE